MALRPHRSFAWDVLWRTLRFFYLLWGGMLLVSMAATNRVRPPAFLWNWPQVAQFLTTPWGRGVLLGIALVLAVAALLEVWELVDLLLVRFLHEHERER
ncbi:MAG: hypothetical protein IPN59_01785 [Holophaga sp.]|nr:hypothetical protein [Holophaga sp.]